MRIVVGVSAGAGSNILMDRRVEVGVWVLGAALCWWFVGLSWCAAGLIVLSVVRAHARLMRKGVPPSVCSWCRSWC